MYIGTCGKYLYTKPRLEVMIIDEDVNNTIMVHHKNDMHECQKNTYQNNGMECSSVLSWVMDNPKGL